MSKGKNHKNSKTSFKVALGFDNFTGEKTNFTVGITLFCFVNCNDYLLHFLFLNS